MAEGMLTLSPIGIIRTPFTDRYRAPRQPGAGGVPSEGRVLLNAGCNYEQALEDLEGFERIWLLYWFDRNEGWRPKVLPPRGPGARRGLFATRSPHRPNPIGLSLVRLLEVRGRRLLVADTDLLDRTPILDIKPYIPYAEAFPEARAGWLDEVMAAERAATPFIIEWSDLAREQERWLREEHAIALADHAVPLLERDPSPHPYRRITGDPAHGYELALKSWRIRFRVVDRRVMIERVTSGYPASALVSGEDLHDHAAQIGFHARWGK
jgi:tRNA-Thr(GGU) m(6)t(6)A37 methyltransferase TsaA